MKGSQVELEVNETRRVKRETIGLAEVNFESVARNSDEPIERRVQIALEKRNETVTPSKSSVLSSTL